MSTDDDRLRLALITASVRSGRFGPTVGEWLAGEIRSATDLLLDSIDLAAIEVPDDPGSADPAAIALRNRIDAADCFVVVTPEYNHSFPGTLKNAIDLAREEWFAKPVAFASYGGIAGGVRAVEHLRGVFAELHAVTIRDALSFRDAHSAFDAAGQPHQRDAASDAAHLMLLQLVWWADALRTARAAGAYPT